MFSVGTFALRSEYTGREKSLNRAAAHLIEMYIAESLGLFLQKFCDINVILLLKKEYFLIACGTFVKEIRGVNSLSVRQFRYKGVDNIGT